MSMNTEAKYKSVTGGDVTILGVTTRETTTRQIVFEDAEGRIRCLTAEKFLEEFDREPVLCRNCAHHRNTMDNPAAPEVWYNQKCAAPKNKTLRDFVFGKPERPACRDVNRDGNCPHFEGKGEA